MDISRQEQRILHMLAQGGHILALKDDKGRIVEVECYNRDGWMLNDCPLWLFSKLRRKKAIRSEASRPYRITRRGLELVRSEVSNR
ncbi:MAG: YjhX family toxin [Alphaproteobacteria bacterium]|nr:YjhX family toxin [Alphaproteobacteria bacterium]